MHRWLTLLILTLTAAIAAPAASAFEPGDVECIAPADKGGGWDFTCRAVGRILAAKGLTPGPVTVSNVSGAGGGIAYGRVAGERAGDDNLLVAASTATASRLAQGRYAGHTAGDVRWLAALGADFGVIAVSPDSPYQNLDELFTAVRDNPRVVAFSGGSPANGWDHMKVLMLARAAGIKNLHELQYLSFNNGGAALEELRAGNVDAFSGDLSEVAESVREGQLRVLGVLADQRLPQAFSELPTAREQGYDTVGANWRGFYMGRETSDDAYTYWVNALQQVAESQAWQTAMQNNGLVEFRRSGNAMVEFINAQITDLESLSKEINASGRAAIEQQIEALRKLSNDGAGG